MSFTSADMAAAVVNIAKGVVRPDVLNTFYATIKKESYDYDYLIQNELVSYKTFEATLHYEDTKYISGRIEDGVYNPYALSKQVMYVQFPYELVETAIREKYRRSEYFGKTVSYYTLKSVTEYYRTMPLVFVNDRINVGFNVKAMDDFTELQFDYGVYRPLTENADLPMVISVIPGSVVASNTSTLVLTNRTFVGTLLDSTKEFTNCSGFFGWFVPKSASNPTVFISDLTYDSSVNTFTIGSTTQIPTISQYDIVVVGFKYFKQFNAYTTSDTYFSLPLQDMAIPKDNLVIVVQNADGVGGHINRNNEIELTEYYPNIYKITNNINRPFYVYAMYCDNPQNELLQYDTELDYYLSKVNLLDRYKANTVPTVLKEYKPITWDYLIEDYETSPYYWSDNMTVTTNPAWGGLLYKLSKVNGWFKRWCAFFQEYIAETYNFMSNWEMVMSTADLTNRLRYDTTDILPDGHSEQQTFPDGAYLFIYNNSDSIGRALPYSWWVNNRFTTPVARIVYGMLEYVYFNAADLTDGDIMDIERYDGANFMHTMTIDGGTEYTMDFMNTAVIASTIWFTDAQGYYLPRNTYTITVKDKAFGDYELPEDSAYLIQPTDVVVFTPISETYNHTTINICANNRSSAFSTYNDPDIDPIDRINLNKGRDIPMTQQDYRSRLRIFTTDGRFMPRTSYVIRTQDNVGDIPSFTIASPTLDATLNIQYTGCNDRLVYHLDELPDNGFLDLEGLLTRPFSLAYHDVFVNGFKLNSSQIEVIGPYHIAIQNIDTKKHFDIYETTYPDELFTYSSGENSEYIADKLYMQDTTYQATVQDALADIIENPLIPDIEDLVDWLGQFISDWMVKNFVNADKWYQGGAPDYFDQWEQVFNSPRRLFNADSRAESNIDEKFTYYLNHDWSKVKAWQHLQSYTREGIVTNLMRVGNKITTEKLTSTTIAVGANNVGIDTVGLDESTFIDKMDVAVGDYTFTYSEVSGWLYKGKSVDLVQYGITFTGYPKNDDTIIVHENTKTVTFEIVDFDHDIPDDTDYTHSITLREFGSDLKLQYSPTPAMYYAENGLVAGTYTVAVSSAFKNTYPSWYGADNITFTLNTAIPVGGQIVLEWQFGKSIVTAPIKTYSDQLSVTPIETVACSSGTTGTSLGTMDGNSTNLNKDYWITCGMDFYPNYVIDKYLNSTGIDWWTGYTGYVYARPPKNVADPGYLYGFPKDFMESIGKTIHYSNGTGTDNVSYNVFIPSLSEVYGSSSTKNGLPYALYKDNSTLSVAGYTKDSAKIYYNSSGIAVFCWLRQYSTSYTNPTALADGSISFGICTSLFTITPFINII